ncbi:MAG: hypothetical protein ABI461_16530 [Polyangiaceae bacterium]
MNRVFIWCCLVVFLLAGCGGSSASKGAMSPATSGGSANGASSAAPEMDIEPAAPSVASESAPPSAAGSALSNDSVARTSPAPEPRDRPGLGTQWGESRSSEVEDVTFTRADDDHPFAVAALHYNDLTGVTQLAAFHDAKSHSFREIPTGNGAISVSIVGENGETLEALHMGDRTYVIGRAGERYSIQLVNHTRHKFETVATVDGLDVMNGRSGSLANRGYVLMPHATLTIDGFRQSHDAVAAFRFSKVNDSYAAQTGTARNVGVIGVAFFTERGDSVIDQRELQTRDTASPFPSDPRFAQPPQR